MSFWNQPLTFSTENKEKRFTFTDEEIAEYEKTRLKKSIYRQKSHDTIILDISKSSWKKREKVDKSLIK